MINLESGQIRLWQWNTGQRLVVSYPVGTVLDFTTGGTAAVRRDVYKEDGCLYADIPNALLQSAGRLYVYVHHIEGDQLTTVLESIFPIRSQPKPPDYIENEQEVLLWHQLDERITRLEESGAGSGGPADAIRYGVAQQLTQEQQAQARTNIGAASDQEDQLELIERIEPAGGQTLIEKSSDPDGKPYSFKAVSISVTIPASVDLAKELTVTLVWANGDQDLFRFGPVGEQTCSVYLECRDGVKRGSFSVNKNGVIQSQPIEVVPAAAAISSVRIEASGKGLETGTLIELLAIRLEISV